MAWFGPAPTLPRPQLFSSVDKSSNQTDHSPSVNAHTIVTHSLPVKCGASRPLATKTNAGKSWRGCLSLLLLSWPLDTHSRLPIPVVPDWHMRHWWCTVERAKLITDVLFPRLVYWQTFVSDPLAKCVSGNCERVPTTRVLGQVMCRMALILHSQMAWLLVNVSTSHGSRQFSDLKIKKHWRFLWCTSHWLRWETDKWPIFVQVYRSHDMSCIRNKSCAVAGNVAGHG